MNSNPLSQLMDDVETILREMGAFKVGVANPSKLFEKYHIGFNPKNIMENCNSIIVFALNASLSFYTSFKYSSGDHIIDFKILDLYRMYVEMSLIEFLKKKGYDAMVIPRKYINEEKKIAPLSYKLAAYEAGIGVFGKSGLIVTPEYGPRVLLGVVLTEAPFNASSKIENFNPCLNCDVCAKSCPAGCINANLQPPESFNREKCLKFVNWLRKTTNGKIMYCGCCFSSCPVGSFKKPFHVYKCKAFADLPKELKERLIAKFNDI